MNEKGFWTQVQKALHLPEAGQAAWKVQDDTNRGLPDALVCLGGLAALVELKYLPEAPKRAWTAVSLRGSSRVALSTEQLRRLTQWKTCGGSAFVLLGIAGGWYLLDPEYEGGTVEEIKRAARTFGDRTSCGLKALAPCLRQAIAQDLERSDFIAARLSDAYGDGGRDAIDRLEPD